MVKKAQKSVLKVSDPFVRRPNIAAELGVSIVTVWRWSNDGTLPALVRIGRTVGLPRSVLDAWKREQGWPDATDDSAGGGVA